MVNRDAKRSKNGVRLQTYQSILQYIERVHIVSSEVGLRRDYKTLYITI